MSSWLTAAWEQLQLGAQPRGQPGSQSPGKSPPKPKPKIGLCIFLACFLIPFGLVGVSFLFGAFKIISSSFPFAKRADATITSVQSSVTRFTFKCLRDDGLMVVVEAAETNGATVSENSTVPVLYYPSNPGKCMLEGSAGVTSEFHGTSSEFPPLPILLLFGMAFTAVSFLVGVVETFTCGWRASGILGALLAPGVFIGCVYYIFFTFIFPVIDAQFAKLQESKVVLADAPNIAGLWQLDSEIGAFVYSFQVNGAEVEVKGRQQSEETWGSSFKGGFVDADTLGWNDQDNSHFRLVFRGDECTGSVRTDLGQEVEFKGFLMP